MTWYRTKNLIVDAVQFEPGAKRPWPACIIAWDLRNRPRDTSYGYIPVPGEKLSVYEHDWILTSRNGEISLCRPEEFERFYEELLHFDGLTSILRGIPTPMPGLTVGRMVHVVLGEHFGQSKGEHRTARVSSVVDAVKGIITAHVDLLPSDMDASFAYEESKISNSLRFSSVSRYYALPMGYLPDLPYSEKKEPGTWHWIERA